MEHRQWVSRYREELKGIAILWVVYFHSKLLLPGAWDTLRAIGYGGVDIFLFLMGMGLFRSLSRGEELRGYATRRLWRVLPAYLPLLLVWMAIMYPTYNLSTVQAARGVAGNLFMVGYWIQTPKVFNWYANAQFLFYLIAPLCFALLARSKRPVYMLCTLLAFSAGVGIAHIGLPQMMAVSRLPIFLLGMAFGMEWPVRARRGVMRMVYLLALVAGLGLLLYSLRAGDGLLIDYGMYWYPFALITPALCVGTAYLFHKLERIALLFMPLRMIGQSSFEIYILNIWMVEVAKAQGVTDAWSWIGLCVANILLGIGYHTLVTLGVRTVRAKLTKAGTPA